MKTEMLISRFAEENKIEYGICTAENFEQMRVVFEKAAVDFAGFIAKDTEKRIYPSLTMENAKSIITIALSYRKNLTAKTDGKPRANISMGAIGKDYHIRMKELFEKIGGIVEKAGGKYAAFSDTGPLCDRAAAKRSNIGFIGKNGCIVTPKNGSTVFLGYIMTDLKLENTKKDFNGCKNCRKCIDACPTGALSDDGFDFRKCISFLTQVKRTLSYEEMCSIGKELYGCDRCQRVCRGENEIIGEAGEIEETMPLISVILDMSQKEFKERFSGTAMGWRGMNVIKRNAVCACLRYKSEDVFEELKKAAFSQSRIVRQAAVRAMILNKTKDSIVFLDEFIKNEKDPEICEDYRSFKNGILEQQRLERQLL